MFRRLVLAAGFAVVALAATSGARAADPVGVAACDEFLTKWAACISNTVPAAQKTRLKGQMDQARKDWTDIAKTPDGKPSLEAVCKKTAEQMTIALSAYGCF